ncbi:hypothetical protein [uncultured Winogradskyella sp.]|uniref:hypothetical protein n=1 Tax=uncultured Winogradskyella sp. TaxID=395353 RepID=UPI00261F4DF4|nr:hypothetical protein [uncultured Winogradskyella sp.]
MKRIVGYILFTLLSGCYVPNDIPNSEFSFEFNGRVEKLEDAFFNSNLNYKDIPSNGFQKRPEYKFHIKRNDSIIDYNVALSDCQSIYSLVKWNDDWNCKSSYLQVWNFTHNLDSLSIKKAREIFNDEVITKLKPIFKSLTNVYRWEVKRFSEDSVYVDILNQKGELRKRHYYSMDTIENSIVNKKIVSFVGDSVTIYRKNASQRYMYFESKKTLHNNLYN